MPTKFLAVGDNFVSSLTLFKSVETLAAPRIRAARPTQDFADRVTALCQQHPQVPVMFVAGANDTQAEIYRHVVAARDPDRILAWDARRWTDWVHKFTCANTR